MRPRFFMNEVSGGADGAAGGAGGGGGTASAGAPAGAGGNTGTLLSGAAPPADPGAGAAPSGGGDWKESLPGIFKENPSLQPFTGFQTQAEMVEALAKSYDETKRMVGTKFQRPAADAPPEKWAEWRKAVGAPDTPEGYGDTLRPGDFPEEFWSKDTEAQARALFHKHHLTPEAVQEIMGLYAGTLKGGLDGAEAEEAQFIQQQSATLRKDWGEKFAENAHQAAGFATAIGLSPDDPIFKRADVVAAMYKATQLISPALLPNSGKPASMGGNAEGMMRDMTDPKSNSDNARAYRGEFGPEKQIEMAELFGRLHETAAAGRK